MASTRNMRAVLPTDRAISQVDLTVIRVRDGMGINGLSISVWRIMQVVKALSGGTGWSFKTAFRESNLIVFGKVFLSLSVPRVPMIWGRT